MMTCYQKHPFEIESEDRLTTINTKIFEIKKKIQLSEGQRKSYYEENEQEKQQNNDLIDTLKKEIKLRLGELRQARAVIGEEEAQVKKYLNDVCPIGSKNADQIIHNLDLKVIEQKKILDLLRYERRHKKKQLGVLEKEYEHLLIESTKSELVKSKISSRARKHISHLENEIHKVLIQWTEAELVKKKYFSIRQALRDDSVKFESSLTRIEELLGKQKEEIAKLEKVREEAADMRVKATAATAAEVARGQDAECSRASERAFFAQRFAERKRELEKLEKRVFPPQARVVVRMDSAHSTEGESAPEEISPIAQMEEIFQRFMKLTGANEAEEVFDKFQAQRETAKRLAYLQQTMEEEKLELEKDQTDLLNDLEAFKFASVKDKDEGQEQIQELKAVIKTVDDEYEGLDTKMEELDTFLLEIKKLLYDLCRLLDIVPEPPIPEWTAEARDVQELVMVLTARYEKATARAEEAKLRQKDSTTITIHSSNPTSAAASVANISMHSHSTPKESEKIVPTYKELLTKEPVKAPHLVIMFCPNKNSYLQLTSAMNPRVINKAVERAMQRYCADAHDEIPAAQRLESMQPSLYAPHVDISRARLGFGRIGLRMLNRQLHAEDYLEQLQAIHSILDQIQISENAMFLVDLHIVYRLIDLMKSENPIIREKVCMIYTHLANYYQGRKRILTRPDIITNLLFMIMRDRKEIRYAAAYTLRTLTRDRCASEMIMKNETVIEDLLKQIKNDHTGIVVLHLKTLHNLTEYDPVRALKGNAFQIMLTLFNDSDPRIISGSMDVMAQLCKHDVGQNLADDNDLTFVLRPFLASEHIEVIISAVGLLSYTTLTTRSKWRAREVCVELTRRLVHLCFTPNMPVLQLRCMQILINLCDCPDVRYNLKENWVNKVKGINIRTHEQWDGTSETTTYGHMTGHNYRTMCLEEVETIKNDYGDNANVVQVHSYLSRIQDTKNRLIATINWTSYD